MNTLLTPGRWSLAPDLTIRSDAFGQSNLMADYRGVIVADLGPALSSSVLNAEEPFAAVEVARRARRHAVEEFDANARLFLAAPDLLRACHTAMYWMTNAPIGSPELDAVMECLNRALLKAEGGAA